MKNQIYNKVSIIIPHYNNYSILDECLKSLKNISYENIEIIIVDNNSTDNSIDFLTNNYPSVIILKLDSNKGFAEPNNIAAKIAKGDCLLFLNNDTIVTPNFISEMIVLITFLQDVRLLFWIYKNFLIVFCIPCIPEVVDKLMRSQDETVDPDRTILLYSRFV